MPVTDALIVVEGPHDAEFVARLLKAVNYNRATEKDSLPPAWQLLVNPNFPRVGRGINQPHEVPQFRMLESGELVTIVIAGEDSKLASALASSVIPLKRLPEAIGFVLDDDRVPDPAVRLAGLVHELTPLLVSQPLSGLTFPAVPGSVQHGPPRTGAFVLPDNQNAGTLEDILLAAGAVHYEGLLTQAHAYVYGLNEAGLTAPDLSERRKPAGMKKEVVGSASSILKPGRALATSLQDNRWLETAALGVPLVHNFRVWLHELLGLPAP